MKVHQFARGIWDHHEPTTLALGCKRLRPLAPKIPSNDTISALDLKSFVRPESGPARRVGVAASFEDRGDSNPHVHSPQVDTHPGGTRWNPTQEQIGILEMLYRGGMRTPNAQQIEQITAQLGKYGKIEGKNVFYWFQNHKARERQKQKRNSLGLNHLPRTTMASSIGITTISSLSPRGGEENGDEDNPYKRKCRSWGFEFLEAGGERRAWSCREEEGDMTTLELFPLRPEGR